MDYTRVIKFVENWLVVIVLFVIIIVLATPFKKMIDKVQFSSAETNTDTVFHMVKNYYNELNLVDAVGLPFKMVFDDKYDKGYIMYQNNVEYNPSNSVRLKIDGQLPSSGSVEIKQDGEVETLNLKFGKYVCSKVSIASNVECLTEK